MTHVLLSHISQQNNKADIAEKLFLENAGSTKIIVSSRHAATEVFTIGGAEQVME